MNSSERQYDSNGGLISFVMCCTKCDTPSRSLPTSWSANKIKSVHNRQYKGHKATVMIDSVRTMNLR